MKCFKMILLCAAMLMASCGDTENEFSNYRCYLVFQNDRHQDMTLASALNPNAPGIFCRISFGAKDGAQCYFFENNQGLTSYKAAMAPDLQRSNVLGVYNESGVIVGYGNLNYPATLYAYDSQCPNCYKATGKPAYRLVMNNVGKATCNRCKREYDMNNGGIISSGDKGDKMIRYRVTSAGQLGILTVTN